VSTFVLVPGAAWRGGWWYEPLVAALEREGHRAEAVTLAGLGPEAMTGAGQVNLASHVEQVASAVAAAAAAGEPVVLVGHSYGGSVITGAADRAPEQVRALVYLDAFVPRDGDSCWSMTNDEQRSWYIQGAGRDGLTVDPLPFFDQRARPHPLATLLQCARLTGAWTRVPAKTYIAATGWPGGLAASPFAPTAARLAVDPTWAYLEWPTRHNVLHDGPHRLFELLRAT